MYARVYVRRVSGNFLEVTHTPQADVWKKEFEEELEGTETRSVDDMTESELEYFKE